MILKNTSRYPDAEVRRLVTLATKGVNMRGVAVHVKNCGNSAYTGRAYQSVPAISTAAREAGADYLIVLRIGPPSRFPTDNMVTTVRRVDVPMAEALADPSNHAFVWSEKKGDYAQRRIETRHPYGGKTSPLIEMVDWREGLVAIASHEARHVHQFRHGKRLSEVDCERFAAKALATYRAQENT